MLALAIIVACVIIGTALGNQAGGFIVGIILAIVVGKRNWKTGTEKTV